MFLPKCIQLFMSIVGFVNLQIPSVGAAISFLPTDNHLKLFSGGPKEWQQRGKSMKV